MDRLLHWASGTMIAPSSHFHFSCGNKKHLWRILGLGLLWSVVTGCDGRAIVAEVVRGYDLANENTMDVDSEQTICAKRDAQGAIIDIAGEPFSNHQVVVRFRNRQLVEEKPETVEQGGEGDAGKDDDADVLPEDDRGFEYFRRYKISYVPWMDAPALPDQVVKQLIAVPPRQPVEVAVLLVDFEGKHEFQKAMENDYREACVGGCRDAGEQACVRACEEDKLGVCELACRSVLGDAHFFWGALRYDAHYVFKGDGGLETNLTTSFYLGDYNNCSALGPGWSPYQG